MTGGYLKGFEHIGRIDFNNFHCLHYFQHLTVGMCIAVTSVAAGVYLNS